MALLRKSLSNPERELFLVEQFFEQFPHLARTPKCRSMDPPHPDIVASWERGDFPIEVTELIGDDAGDAGKGSAARAAQSHFRVLQEELAAQANIDPAFAKFSGALALRVGAVEVRKMAKRYAEAIRKYVLSEYADIPLYKYHSINPLLPDRSQVDRFRKSAVGQFLNSINVIRQEHGCVDSPIRWEDSDRGFIIPSLSIDVLRAAIIKKSKKTYSTSIDRDRIWLLLIATGQTSEEHFLPFDMMLEQLFDPSVLAAAATTGFGKVVVWDYVGGQATDLLDDSRQILSTQS
ncbi:hypothetical protein [Aeoliella sp. SH292]|uniref:hypothetical protein n=1 Tax=Aeoliella sp. SH292 TaxID=3454464 RepID=UPI003F9E1F0A